MLHDGVEQRTQIVRRIVHGALGHAGFGDGVEHREIELVLGGVEVDEQVVDLVEDFLHARVGPVDLVDHHDGRQLGFERLRQHVARLRQRAFAGVHQQHDAVHHLERALHFAAEIAVAGRIDDVDLDAVVTDAGDLGEDGDAALAFQLVGIHDAFHVLLVLAEDAALVEHGVHQRGLAMVHVGDDGDVANGGVAGFHLEGGTFGDPNCQSNMPLETGSRGGVNAGSTSHHARGDHLVMPRVHPLGLYPQQQLQFLHAAGRIDASRDQFLA